MRSILSVICAVSLICPTVWAGEANSRKAAQVITPDGVCASVSKIDDDQVFLTSRKGTCKSTSIPVMVDKNVYKVRVYVDDKPWMEQGLVAAALPDMESMQAQTRALTDSIKMPDPEKNKEAIVAGQKIGDYMNSEVYQAKVLAEAERIRNEVLNEPDLLKKFYPDGKTPKKDQGGVLSIGERVYIFISSSMPPETLRNYAISVDKVGDPNVVMVMRGMIGGISKMIPTMEFIAKFLLTDPGCIEKNKMNPSSASCNSYGAEVIIDPMLFTRYDISKVPAVVYATGIKPFDPEGSEGFEGNTKLGASKTVYGDASLDGIIETIADNTKSKTLEALLKKLRTGYYN